MFEKFKNKVTVAKTKQRLLDEMAKLPQTSAEYSRLNTELNKLTEAENNQNGWKGALGVGIAQTIISAVASTVNVWTVLKHEDRGNVVTTKSLNYVEEPQNQTRTKI